MSVASSQIKLGTNFQEYDGERAHSIWRERRGTYLDISSTSGAFAKLRSDQTLYLDESGTRGHRRGCLQCIFPTADV